MDHNRKEYKAPSYNFERKKMRRNSIKSKSTKKQQNIKIEEQQSDSSSEIEVHEKDYFTLRHRKDKKIVRPPEDESVSLLRKYNNENYKKYVSHLREMYELGREDGAIVKKYEEPELQKLIYMGDNLCFYGYGSKREFLAGMRQKFFPESYCWEVKGYLPTINIKKIYNNFGIFLKAAGLVTKISSITMVEQLQQYYQILYKYSTKHPKISQKLIILFHCIDGQNLLSIDNQAHLSHLFNLPAIRVLCTFDNTKIVMLWSPRLKQNFKFLFYKIDTNIPSTQQQLVRPNPNEKTDRTQKRIMNIVQSLNANQKRILKIIAKNQLDNLNRDIPSHYTVTQLLDVCIEEVILSNDTQLRQNLIELLDHDVIQEKDEPIRNKKVLTIKLQKKLLQKLCDMKVD